MYPRILLSASEFVLICELPRYNTVRVVVVHSFLKVTACYLRCGSLEISAECNVLSCLMN